MIDVVAGTVIVAAFLEYFIHRQNLMSKVNYEKAVLLNSFLETLKVLSYAPASHKATLLDDLNDIFPSLFTWSNLTAILLADKTSPRIKTYYFRKAGGSIQENDKLSELVNFLAGQCEKQSGFADQASAALQKIDNSSTSYLLTEPPAEISKKNNFNLTSEESAWPQVVVTLLLYKSAVVGWLYFITEKSELNETESRFLQSAGNVITLLVKKHEINRVLSHVEQIEAVGKVW